ncbi:MAG: hypothetical protein E7266_08215 [Lachnospiraceae bacterium]|nr:hypothetical protein [Lachnospiraceae bacterium]
MDNDEGKVISDDDIFKYIFDDEARSRRLEDVEPVSNKPKDRSIFNEMEELETQHRQARREMSSAREYRSVNNRRRRGRRNKYDRSRNLPLGLDKVADFIDSIKPEKKWIFGNILFFPILLIYLEFVFHLVMDKELTKYTFIYILLSIPAGLFMSLFTLLFNEITNRIITYLLTFFVCLLFAAEFVIVIIFQLYTPIFSMFDMTGQIAGETNFVMVAVNAVLDRIFTIILFFLPMVFILTVGSIFFEFRRRKILFSGIVLGGAIVLQVVAVLSLGLPWGVGAGVYTPKELYKMDTAINEQVNKLGVFTMIRLDLKYILFPTDTYISGDVEVDMPDLPDIPSSGDVNDPSEDTPTTEEPIDTSPNIMDIDFAALIDSESDSSIVKIHKYVSQKNDDGTYTWATNKNEYTGMFEGYNVIFIVAEGFSKYGLIPELMPTLYRLSNEGFVFNNFYTPLHFTSTIGGEFQSITGIYPKDGQKSSIVTGKNGSNMYFTLAKQLNRLQYSSYAYHNGSDPKYYDRHISHPNFGYEWRPAKEWYELEKKENGSIYWPQSDLHMIENTIGDYLNVVSPFNVYYLTVSGHVQYNFSGNAMSIKNKEAVAHLPYGETARAYIACQLELEKAVAKIVEELETTGLDKNTLLVLTPDHIPYFNVSNVLAELAGHEFGKETMEYVGKESGLDFDVYRNTLIMWSGSMEEPVVVDKVCGQVDILPTVSNLLGLEYDSRLLIGSDILSDSQGIVVLASKSWITDIGVYNIQDKKFTLAEGLDESVYTDEYIKQYIKAMTNIAKKKVEMSASIISTDYYNSIPLLKDK